MSRSSHPTSPPAMPNSAAPPPAPSSGVVSRLDSFLSAHRVWVLAVIVLSSLAVRAVYFRQANAGPLLRMHEWDQSDMSYYDHWARTILDGDPLCELLWPPHHFWHGLIAETWMKQNPELRAEMQREAEQLGPKITAEQVLWRNWLGPKRFYQEPGYPYLIALTYAVCGRSPHWVLLWQMGLGILSALLVWRITNRHFGATAAAVAGMAAATCSPTLCYELLLLRDCLLVFLSLVLVELTDQALARGRLGWWALLGGAVGCGLAVKGIFNLYLVGVLGLLVATYWRQWGPMLLRAGVVLAAMLAVLSPIIVRNMAVGVAPFALAGNAGFAFIQNNAPDYKWIYPNLVNEEYFPEIAGRTGGQLLPAMVATLRAHPSVWSVVWMYCCKFDAAWHWWERPDNVSSYFYELYAPILRWLPVNFTIISPLALVGLGLTLRDFRRHKSLYLVVFVTLVPMLLFNVLGRFRLPMVVAVLPFAAMSVVQAAAWLSERRWWKGGCTVAAAVLLGVWFSRPLPAEVSLARGCDFAATFGFYYQAPVMEAVRGQRWPEAITYLENFVRHEPPVLRDATPADRAQGRDQQTIALLLSDANRHCGGLQLLCGDRAAAESHFQRSLFLRRYATGR